MGAVRRDKYSGRRGVIKCPVQTAIQGPLGEGFGCRTARRRRRILDETLHAPDLVVDCGAALDGGLLASRLASMVAVTRPQRYAFSGLPAARLADGLRGCRGLRLRFIGVASDEVRTVVNAGSPHPAVASGHKPRKPESPVARGHRVPTPRFAKFARGYDEGRKRN